MDRFTYVTYLSNRLSEMKKEYAELCETMRQSEEGKRMLENIKLTSQWLDEELSNVETRPCDRSYGDAIKYLKRRLIYRILDWLCLCLTFICFALVGYAIGSYVVQHEWFGVFAFLLIGLLVAACLYMQIKEIDL